jgi:hypothetical protein
MSKIIILSKFQMIVDILNHNYFDLFNILRISRIWRNKNVEFVEKNKNCYFRFINVIE